MDGSSYIILSEMAVIPFDILLCIYQRVKSDAKDKRREVFFVLCVFITLATISDVIFGACLNHMTSVPGGLILLAGALNHLLGSYVGYYFVEYVFVYVEKDSFQSVMHMVNRGLFLLAHALVLLNLPTGLVFGIEGVVLVEGPLYALSVYIIPGYFMVFGIVYMFLNPSRYSVEQRFAILLGAVVTGAFMLLQGMISARLFIAYLVISVDMFLIFFGLDAPVYRTLEAMQLTLAKESAEAERNRDEAIRANRAKSVFLRNMSHEIRTPMNTILGLNAAMARKTKDEELRALTLEVKAKGLYLLSIMDDILDMAALSEEERMLDGTGEDVPWTGVPDTEKDAPDAAQPERQDDITVLAVDDNEMNLVVVRELLDGTDIRVEIAESGAKALRMMQTKRYDAVLLDHFMPELDGIAVLRRIREREREVWYRTPVIVLTANAVTGSHEYYLEAGFDDYLSKPVEREALVAKIRKWAKREEDA